MQIVGVNCDKLVSNDLGKTLKAVVEAGYKSCELNLNMIPFIIGGELCYEYINYAKEIIEKYELTYTAHIGSGIDLRSTDMFELNKKVLFSSIELCNLLGIKLLTVHFEEKSKIRWIEKRFNETYIEANKFAKEKNVIISIENIEVENYKYVLECIKEVNDENFVMTLDTGHLFLACNYFGQDFYTAVDECIPYIRNIHLNDNVGLFMPLRLEDFQRYKGVPMPYRTTFGLGDIHVPPFFGKAPLDYVLEKIKNRMDMIITCEYERETFEKFDKYICEKVNRKLAEQNIS